MMEWLQLLNRILCHRKNISSYRRLNSWKCIFCTYNPQYQDKKQFSSLHKMFHSSIEGNWSGSECNFYIQLHPHKTLPHRPDMYWSLSIKSSFPDREYRPNWHPSKNCYNTFYTMCRQYTSGIRLSKTYTISLLLSLYDKSLQYKKDRWYLTCISRTWTFFNCNVDKAYLYWGSNPTGMTHRPLLNSTRSSCIEGDMLYRSLQLGKTLPRSLNSMLKCYRSHSYLRMANNWYRKCSILVNRHSKKSKFHNLCRGKYISRKFRQFFSTFHLYIRGKSCCYCSLSNLIDILSMNKK